MIEYAKLELRRNRILFIGMALTFLGSLPFVCAVMSLNHYPVSQGLDATLIFWILVGLPGMAVLFGAAGGVDLRAQPVHDAEEPLPLSPRAKVAGAVLALGFYLLLTALLVLAAAAVLSPAWRSLLLGPQTRSTIFLRPLFALLPFEMAHILLASFVCAYGFRQGIFGGFFGALLGTIAIAALALGFGLQTIFEYRAPFTGRGLVSIAVAMGGVMAALAWTAPWVERRPRWEWRKALIIVLALIAGPLTAYIAVSSTHRRLSSSLYLISRTDRFEPLRTHSPIRHPSDAPR